MGFFENWVEMDLNPILSFSSSGKILYSNQEAQFLLSRIPSKEVFDIALKHAPKTFGVETSYIDLHMKNYIFYAVTVSYEDEEAINIKLYKSTMVKKESKLNTKNSDMGNIFTLVDLSISAMKSKSNIKFIKNYDPSIPDFKLNAKEFMKILNAALVCFDNSTIITATVMLKIGEYIRIEGKKYSLISIELTGNVPANLNKFNYDEANSYFILTKDKSKFSIDLPLILK
ncbi:hypothetical protein [Arcobacter sp. CECT 8985]|uniref:hypothetical protein n=1 Tax=Arcobacter sp. CECT 8985 TaxID=1935424 RepID=UPI00100AFA64|nr:hypothetical protein [Arcobacter sp. CECT 8985]RXJ88112.1 hypothetical protein CRU93_00515 [Arcobacter sp. CECT 8985]